MDATHAEEVKYPVGQRFQGFNVRGYFHAQKLFSGEERRAFFAGGIGFFFIAGAVDPEGDFIWVIKFQRGGFGISDFTKWCFVGALVGGK